MALEPQGTAQGPGAAVGFSPAGWWEPPWLERAQGVQGGRRGLTASCGSLKYEVAWMTSRVAHSTVPPKEHRACHLQQAQAAVDGCTQVRGRHAMAR